ncbi:hypothetical protein GWK47_047523 [Chionoecetes opilio]|uniref:Integrase catalytic domain-containing protein n=1 Tax=Chionoecetes opilio TaxID=41210 RepID=A0A8J4YCT8_CHIOP|nr:hypothetical protein GWK47_047523 [Chionoecetes opilio]
MTFSPSRNSFLVIADGLAGGRGGRPFGPILPTAHLRLFCRVHFRMLVSRSASGLTAGPQFTSTAFRNFTKRWGVYHAVSSPHYPQSNGPPCGRPSPVKHLILKTAPNGNIDSEDFDRGLLERSTTPNSRDDPLHDTLWPPAPLLCPMPILSPFSEEWQASYRGL